MTHFRTFSDVLHLVEYSTALEGMAVLAARDPRMREQALADDEDYVALSDERRMEQDEERYFKEYDDLVTRKPERLVPTYRQIVRR
jgi:hypothetical protein